MAYGMSIGTIDRPEINYQLISTQYGKKAINESRRQQKKLQQLQQLKWSGTQPVTLLHELEERFRKQERV